MLRVAVPPELIACSPRGVLCPDMLRHVPESYWRYRRTRRRRRQRWTWRSWGRRWRATARPTAGKSRAAFAPSLPSKRAAVLQITAAEARVELCDAAPRIGLAGLATRLGARELLVLDVIADGDTRGRVLSARLPGPIVCLDSHSGPMLASAGLPDCRRAGASCCRARGQFQCGQSHERTPCAAHRSARARFRTFSAAKSDETFGASAAPAPAAAAQQQLGSAPEKGTPDQLQLQTQTID